MQNWQESRRRIGSPGSTFGELERSRAMIRFRAPGGSKVWDHIRKNKLQNPQNKREIVADDKLRKVFGKDRVTMFEMNKHLSNHLK